MLYAGFSPENREKSTSQMRCRVKSSSVALAGTFVATLRGDGDEFTVTGIRRVGGIRGREETAGRMEAARAARGENTGEFNFYVTLHLRSLIPAPLCTSGGGRGETLDRRTPFAV